MNWPKRSTGLLQGRQRRFRTLRRTTVYRRLRRGRLARGVRLARYGIKFRIESNTAIRESALTRPPPSTVGDRSGFSGKHIDVERRDWESGSGYWHVSKLILVSRLQAMLNSRELRIAESLQEARALAGLQNFRATISESGIATFGARVGRHDDLVLALALACWHLARSSKSTMKVQPLEL
jgi:hypothetical protein